METLNRVLDGRFPRNALLSHDLIEGAYARAGLVSDIEIIEDYPSHYSAHNRRKHRWLRGDWQISSWLRRQVPDESGACRAATARRLLTLRGAAVIRSSAQVPPAPPCRSAVNEARDFRFDPQVRPASANAPTSGLARMARCQDVTA